MSKKIKHEADWVNKALDLTLYPVNEQGRHWTIFKDETRTSRVASMLTASEVLATLQTIYKLQSCGLIQGVEV